MDQSRRLFKPLVLMIFLVIVWHYSGLFHDHARGCGVGSMYVITLEPQEPKPGQAVTLTLSVAESDPGPIIRLLMKLERPDGSTSHMPLQVKLNEGGFANTTLPLEVGSAGTYKIVLEKRSGSDMVVVATKEFSVSGPAPEAKPPPKAEVQTPAGPKGEATGLPNVLYYGLIALLLLAALIFLIARKRRS